MSRAPLVLEEYDPTWTKKFEEEKEYLLSIVGKWNFGSV